MIVTVLVCVNLTLVVPLPVVVGSGIPHVAGSVAIGCVETTVGHCGRGLPSMSRGLKDMVLPAL